MRRAERLFQIIQRLRRARGPLTAEQLAAELELSKRTVYRDVAALLAQQVPIRGEAGVGYVLDRAYDMPALQLTPDELEAAALGAQWVAEHADRTLALAARDLISKISTSVPPHLRAFVTQPSIVPAPPRQTALDRIDLSKLRRWIREGRKVRLTYLDVSGRRSERTVWPVMLGYAESMRFVSGWCELREDFRNFSAHRIERLRFLDERFDDPPGVLRRWKAHLKRERGVSLG